MDTLRGQFDNDDLLRDLPDELISDLQDEGLLGDDFAEAPPSPVGQDERRMQVRAYNHWAGLLGDHSFPAIEDLDPNNLEDFGPYSVLLDFTAGIENPGVQYLGAKLAEECGTDVAIKNLEDVPSLSLLSRITDHYMQIMANQAPIGFEAEFVNQRDATVMYRGILLPYSSDDETIDFIYGVINWKEMADDETADELLLEIGQALGVDDGDDSDDSDDEEVLDLGLIGVVTGDHNHNHEDGDGAESGLAMPEPAFGHALNNASHDNASHDEASEFDDSDLEVGDDIDGHERDGSDETTVFVQPDFGDDDVDEDGEEIIANDDALPSLMGISIDKAAGEGKVAISFSDPAPADYGDAQDSDAADEVVADTPSDFNTFYNDTAYSESANDSADSADSASSELPDLLTSADNEPREYTEAGPEFGASYDDVPPAGFAPEEVPVPAMTEAADDAEPEGLHECLAVAREVAYTARNSEDRSRAALYDAVSRAYDVSIEASQAPEEFAELLEDNGMSVQDRAPMTPVVKLVFGADYDKTRITEYATVLAHASRVGVERGGLTDLLAGTDGGLKQIVKTERKLRREEKGETVVERTEPRAAIANKLRAMPPQSLADLPIDGAEFALVLVRRTEEGELVVLGEVPQDVPLVERAARKLIG